MDAKEEDRVQWSLITKYLGAHVNSSFGDDSKSVMSIFCSLVCSDSEQISRYRKLVDLLLMSKNVEWIPQTDYNPSANPLGILLEEARKKLSVMSIAEFMIEWCLGQARLGGPEYLFFVLQCMPKLSHAHPEMALKAAQYFAHSPVRSKDHSFIMGNHSVVAPPPIGRLLWSQKPIYECHNPILQFRLNNEQPDPKNANFTEGIYVASFNLLWSVVKPPDDHSLEFVQSKVPPPSPWKVLWHLALRQFNLSGDIYIYPHYYKLEILNNPAIEALILYKWNKFAYSLWLSRFLAQFCYYVLVVIAAIVQVYSEEQDSLFFVFVAIISFSTWFLVLEILHWWELRRIGSNNVYPEEKPKGLRYFRSFYNALDLAAFLIPMAASINQLINISQKNLDGATWDLSFSIIIMFLHLVSELRVFQPMCKYVTIIIHIITEIWVFFLVFFLGILFFSLAIQHVIRGCPSNGCEAKSTDFPLNFWEAIISTYFIMGGRYDPVATEFSDTPRASLQAMMVIYFMFAVILMLNVLIALINGGFNHGDGKWRVVWLENLLRYVESAEEMSYHITGFRENSGWFPREIYYTATKAQVSEYEDNVLKKNGEIQDIIDRRIQLTLEKHQLKSKELFEKLKIIVTKAENPTSNGEGRLEARDNATTEENSIAIGGRGDTDDGDGVGEDEYVCEVVHEEDEVAGAEEGTEEDNMTTAVAAHVPDGLRSAGPSTSSNRQEVSRRGIGSGRKRPSDEGEHDPTELQQLRAQVGDLVKQQADLFKQQNDLIKQKEDTHRHNLQLEQLIVRLMEKLDKDI
ncbi:hypothetical protein BGZ74_002053 [Mortierella antarctica]|nr:hypothetical protein BGZ74_002053 [Mortierella antarctica]